MRCIIWSQRLQIHGIALSDPGVEIPPIKHKIHNIEEKDYVEFLYSFAGKLRRYPKTAAYAKDQKRLLSSISKSLRSWLKDFDRRHKKYV